MRTITPNSGPITGDTVVTVHGEGFFESENMRCRFGVAGNYATVQAKLISS
ncbi:MAG: hypothetical protein COA94_09075 [Rickettsiales bacterium]|nr:MAG: hypothetical protein COA94_09075 [Rickettsiales bacterium]